MLARLQLRSKLAYLIPAAETLLTMPLLRALLHSRPTMMPRRCMQLSDTDNYGGIADFTGGSLALALNDHSSRRATKCSLMPAQRRTFPHGYAGREPAWP